MSKRVALVKDGRVHSVEIVDHHFAEPGYVESETANIGDKHDGVSFLEPPPLSKEDLLIHAEQVRRWMMTRRLEVEIEIPGSGKKPKITKLSISSDMRRDIADLAFSKVGAMLVFKGQAIDFDASQITQLHKLIAERVAKMQAILGSIAHAIEAGQITSIEEIDSPEKIEGLKLDSWNA